MVEEMEQVIKDEQGRQYLLRVTGDDRSFVSKLLFQDDEVGKANCVFHPQGEMLIGDLIIEDNVTHMSENLWFRAGRRCLSPSPRTTEAED